MKKINEHIVEWLKKELTKSHQKGFVIGISGGIDSAVVSTLIAETGYPVLCLTLPIHQNTSESTMGDRHIQWLMDKYPNVSVKGIDLSDEYDSLVKKFNTENDELACVNTRSRLRMTTLYHFANSLGYLVAGTGNKIEDFGIKFFTKHGDGAVDLSPIGDLMKSEVYALGAYLGVNDEILKARPTDGLWTDGRTDEDQIGATYDELEWAMDECEKKYPLEREIPEVIYTLSDYNERQKEVMKIYIKRYNGGLHKMKMPPICKIEK